jgi:hypothetical protein
LAAIPVSRLGRIGRRGENTPPQPVEKITYKLYGILKTARTATTTVRITEFAAMLDAVETASAMSRVTVGSESVQHEPANFEVVYQAAKRARGLQGRSGLCNLETAYTATIWCTILVRSLFTPA